MATKTPIVLPTAPIPKGLKILPIKAGPFTITSGWAYVIVFGAFLWLGSTALYGIPIAFLVTAITYQIITIFNQSSSKKSATGKPA